MSAHLRDSVGAAQLADEALLAGTRAGGPQTVLLPQRVHGFHQLCQDCRREGETTSVKRLMKGLELVAWMQIQSYDTDGWAVVDCTCARNDLRWHQVFVVVGLTFDTLQPAVEVLVC